MKNNKQRDNEAAEHVNASRRRESDKENDEDVEVHDVLGEQGEQDVIF